MASNTAIIKPEGNLSNGCKGNDKTVKKLLIVKQILLVDSLMYEQYEEYAY